MEIVGVKIDEVTKKDAINTAGVFLRGNEAKKIFTPNPEMLVKAQKDGYFKKVLNSGDLNLCDGFGVWFVARLSSSPQRVSSRWIPVSSGMTGKRIERITGVDFMIELCRIASDTGRSVYLLGSGSDEAVKGAVDKLQEMFPTLKIVGYDKGLEIEELRIENYELRKDNSSLDSKFLIHDSGLNVNLSENGKLIERINASKADILFVAFGMGKQEKWIYENLERLPSVKIAMGVGGSFDYLSGKMPRAPLLMRKIGLEWFYRLWKQPRRIGRIFNATGRFLWHLLLIEAD